MIETWFNQDVKKAVKVQYLDGNVFSQDNNGNKVGVCLYDGENTVNVSGSVSANVIRSDGATVAVTGSSSGNQAWVVLPQSCYAIPGVISIVIKATDSSDVTTLCAVVANVYQSSTDTAVDPGTIIPSISDLIAEIEAAIASIPADYSSLWTSLAPVYSNTETYLVGQYVTYNGKLYRCTTAIVGGESWTSGHWTQVSLGSDVGDNRIAFNGVPTRNLIDDFPFVYETKRDIVCNKISSGVFHLQGTKGTGSGTQEFVLYRNYSKIPASFKVGNTYFVYIAAGSAFVWFTGYKNNTSTGSVTLFRSNRPLNGEQYASFTIPDDCTGMGITIRFDDASSFNEDVIIYVIEKCSVPKRNAITNSLFIESNETLDSMPNIVAGYNIKNSPTNGVNGKKISDNEYHIEGTITTPGNWSTLDLYRSHTVMPEGFSAGKTYAVFLDSVDVSLWIVKYNGDEDTNGVAIYKSENNKNGEQFGVFTIPSTEVQGLSIGLKCDYASSFNEDVTVYISEVKSASEQDFVASVYGVPRTQRNKKLYSIGNSFLTGIIYTNGQQSGRCSFDDSIYGQIATSLDITPENTNHVYHPNTGFISPSSSPAYDAHSTVILGTDLSGYDYCLTHFNRSDLRKTLGTVNADGTGSTLADAVVNIANYIKTNKWITKLIFLGTPPYDADAVDADNVFYFLENGNTINDMDNLMYALALKYHFIYVSWQDLEISYHYMDFCDYQPGDTGARHGKSAETYRALGEYASTQIPAVSSPIAVKKLMTLQNT